MKAIKWFITAALVVFCIPSFAQEQPSNEYVQAVCTRYSKFVGFVANEYISKGIPVSGVMAGVDRVFKDKGDADVLKSIVIYTYENVPNFNDKDIMNRFVMRAANSIYIQCYQQNTK